MLKTLGLLYLMAQSGLYITAALGAQIPVFQEVLVGIGDYQSIQQSLSTYSSGMKFFWYEEHWKDTEKGR